MKAALCPVCNGTGKYTGDWDPNVTDCPEWITCHGCGGKGWIEVHDYICHPCDINADITGVLTVSNAKDKMYRRMEYYPFLEPQ